jgi:hypothetical protein
VRHRGPGQRLRAEHVGEPANNFSSCFHPTGKTCQLSPSGRPAGAQLATLCATTQRTLDTNESIFHVTRRCFTGSTRAMIVSVGHNPPEDALSSVPPCPISGRTPLQLSHRGLAPSPVDRCPGPRWLCQIRQGDQVGQAMSRRTLALPSRAVLSSAQQSTPHELVIGPSLHAALEPARTEDTRSSSLRRHTNSSRNTEFFAISR